jgi:hypothetical protein
MDAQDVLTRLPAAEATLQLLNVILEFEFLDSWYQAHRGGTYNRVLTFSEFVGILRDCLLVNSSVHQHWSRNEAERDLSVQAYYRKLGRVPVKLSEQFLSATTARLTELVSFESQRAMPASLKEFRPLLVDARTIKHAAKRLLPTRSQAGAALGGKTLAALDPATGLIVAFSATVDGEANETTLLEGLLRQLPPDPTRPALFVADRQYGDLTQPRRFAQAGDYLIRVAKRLTFQADSRRPARNHRDAEGREVIEEWGELGQQNSLTVRRLTVKRSDGDDLIAITSLMDGDRHPAVDLLELYRERWTIEAVFREVVKVFGLERLIGSRPLAMVFQASFCMLLYNVTQGLRQIAARTQSIEAETISTVKMFDGIRRSLTALNELLTPLEYVPRMSGWGSLDEVRTRLADCLRRAWRPYWRKRPKGKPKPRVARPKKSGGHFSVQRVIDEHEAKKRANRKANDV